MNIFIALLHKIYFASVSQIILFVFIFLSRIVKRVLGSDLSISQVILYLKIRPGI